MASLYWAKVYIEILDDAKMGFLSDRLWRRTIELILLAKEKDKRGFLPSIHDMAWRLHVDPITLEEELGQLAKMKITKVIKGDWQVCNFVKWQSADSDADRMTRYRERQKKKEKHDDVTQQLRNSYATVTQRNTEKIREEKNREEKNTSTLSWSEILKDLKGRMTASTFNDLFHDSEMAIIDEVAVIYCDNQLAADRINHQLKQVINDSIQACGINGFNDVWARPKKQVHDAEN